MALFAANGASRNGLARRLDRHEIRHLVRTGFTLCGLDALDLKPNRPGPAPRCTNCLRTSDGAQADWGDTE